MAKKQILSPGTWPAKTRVAINLQHVSPVPKGSMRGFVHGKRAIVVDSKSRELSAYGKEVRLLALEEMKRRGLPCAYRQPFEVIAVFFLPRAGTHFGAKGLRADAPCYPHQKPDFDKLVRAVCDELTGIVWDDDSRIVRSVIEKRFASAQRDIGLYFEARVLPATQHELSEMQQTALPAVGK